MERAYKRIVTAAAVGLLACLLAVMPVAADPASPTSFQILSVNVFRNLHESGDALYVFHYNIYYASSQPTTSVNKLFLFRLMDTDGTTPLGSTVPYPYNNSGYDEGVGGFYFAAGDAPTWQAALTIRMEGNPQYWSSPPVATHTLILSEYCGSASVSVNRSQLGGWILDTSTDLEISWGIKLVTEGASGTVLTTTGETYYKGTIGGIKEMCPQIFSITNEPLDTTSYPPVTDTSMIYTWEHQWDGTWVETSLSSLGDLFGIGWKMVVLAGVLILSVALAAFTQIKWGTTDPAFWGGLVIFAFFGVEGMIDWQPLGAILLLCILYIVYIVFWRNG